MKTRTPLYLAIISFIATNSVYAASVTSFTDNFINSTLDSSKWNALSNGSPNGDIVLSEGLANFGCGNYLDTHGKATFSGNEIIIETKFIGTGSSRDSYVALVNVANGDRIQMGDTDYSATATPGMYSYGTGEFNLYQAGNENSVNTYKEYRFTISGSSLKMERGDTLANITETSTATLSSSIAGKTFYLSIGTGGRTDIPSDYCPATFDWVRVSASIVKGAVTWAKPPYFVQCTNNTTSKSISIPKNRKTNYDCEKSGLVVKSGDDISVTIRGRKY